MTLVKHLWKGIELQSSKPEVVEGDGTFAPAQLVKLADVLRGMMGGNGMGEELRKEAASQIALLQGTSDAMMRHSLNISERVYKTELLVRALVLASYLSAPDDLNEVILMAIRIAIPIPSVSSYFTDILSQQPRVPSRPSKDFGYA